MSIFGSPTVAGTPPEPEEHEAERKPSAAPLAVTEATPSAVAMMMQRAVELGPDGVAALRELVQLDRELRQERAVLMFSQALARFQAKCPPVPTDAALTHLSRTTKEGVKKPVQYATIQALRDHMQPYLSAEGFSLSLDSETDADTVTAIWTLRHEAGHAQQARYRIPTAAKTPAMSPQHAHESAYSFACRIALRSVTGVRVAADDEQAVNEADPTTITEEQAATLDALLEEVGANRVKFLLWLRVANLNELRAADYDMAVKALEAKRKGA